MSKRCNVCSVSEAFSFCDFYKNKCNHGFNEIQLIFNTILKMFNVKNQICSLLSHSSVELLLLNWKYCLSILFVMSSTQDYSNQDIDINVIVSINSTSVLIKEDKAEQCPISSSLGQWKNNTYGCISQFVGKAQGQVRFFFLKGRQCFFSKYLMVS